MVTFFKTVRSSILSGVFISLGATAYLSVGSTLLGAILFTVGLTAVLGFQTDLFTGKCGMLIIQKHPLSYIIYLIEVWTGNLIGCSLVAVLVRKTTTEGILQRVNDIVTTKLSLPLANLLILGIFCGMLMYVAVSGYLRNQSSNSSIASLCYLLGVVVFILCGFEHCVADMYYFILNDISIGVMLSPLLAITLGNLIGSNFLQILLIKNS